MATAKAAAGKTTTPRARKPTRSRAASAKKTATKAVDAAAKVDTATQASEEKVRATAASIKDAAEKAIAATHAPEAAKAVKDGAKSVAAKARGATAKAPARRGSARPAKAAPAKSGGKSGGMGTGAVIGVAAAGIVAGIAANLGRKAAVQAPSVMAGDWLEALKAEHRMALTLLDRLAQSKPEQPAKRTLLLAQLKHALGKHAFSEENVIYPALREWGDKADADALNHEQGYHKQFLYELERMDKSAPGFAKLVADFRADLEKHIREEEDKILPQLHKGLTEEQNRTLTQMANKEGFKLA